MDNITQLAVDGDSLVYVNAWAAQQTHYMPVIRNKDFMEEPFRYKKDYTAWLKDQPDSVKKIVTCDKREVRLPASVAFGSIDRTIMWSRKHTGAKSIKVYLTSEDKSNFRFGLATIWGYKANRDSSNKPVYYDECRQHIIDHWGAEVVTGEEADDAVSYFQYMNYERFRSGCYDDTNITCIAHADKDINMIPGWHWSLGKEERLYWVSEVDAWRTFFTQLITGDPQVDNIPGLCQLTGKMATKKIKDPIQSMDDPKQMLEYVYNIWDERAPASIMKMDEDGDPYECKWDTTEVLSEIGNLLWMRRHPGETWEEYMRYGA